MIVNVRQSKNLTFAHIGQLDAKQFAICKILPLKQTGGK